MSLEDDQLAAMKELVDKAIANPPFIGNVTSADPLQVVVAGASVAVPAFALNGTFAQGDQVLVMPVNKSYYVLGKVGSAVAPPTPDVTEVETYLSVDTNYGTSLTNILSLAIPSAGTWRIRGEQGWHLVGSTNQFTQMDFTGTLTDYYIDYLRFTEAANAGDLQYVLGTSINMGQTTPQLCRWTGHLVVSVPGNINIGFNRTAGTSGTVHMGAYLRADKLA